MLAGVNFHFRKYIFLSLSALTFFFQAVFQGHGSYPGPTRLLYIRSCRCYGCGFKIFFSINIIQCICICLYFSTTLLVSAELLYVINSNWATSPGSYSLNVTSFAQSCRHLFSRDTCGKLHPGTASRGGGGGAQGGPSYDFFWLVSSAVSHVHDDTP